MVLGSALVAGMSGSRAAYWARTLDHAAKTMFNTLRDMPEPPAEFVSADVCEVISQM